MNRAPRYVEPNSKSKHDTIDAVNKFKQNSTLEILFIYSEHRDLFSLTHMDVNIMNPNSNTLSITDNTIHSTILCT